MKRIWLLLLSLCLLPLDNVRSQTFQIREKLAEIQAQVRVDRLESNIRTLVSFHNRNTFSDTVAPDRGIGAARRWLYGEFKKVGDASNGQVRVYNDSFFQKLSPRYKQALGQDSVKLTNVIAELGGAESERCLIILGHYDSRAQNGMDTKSFAPGANDDGSGTVALLELARVLSNYRLKNKIILAAVPGEEQGLWGSRHLAQKAKEEGWQVEGVIANDMIGNISGGDGKTDNTILRCFSPDPDDSPSRNFALFLKQVEQQFFPRLSLKMIFRLDRFGRGGDHAPFIQQDFAGVRFTEPYENYAHQHSQLDTPENMSFEYFKRTVQLNAVLAYYWAQTPAPPRLVGIRRTKNYNTRLFFHCEEKEENLSGFVVHIRETDSGYWQERHFFPVPDKVESRQFGSLYQITLTNRDQDYYVFGIASVNNDGYESIPATYTRPRRR